MLCFPLANKFRLIHLHLIFRDEKSQHRMNALANEISAALADLEKKKLIVLNALFVSIISVNPFLLYFLCADQPGKPWPQPGISLKAALTNSS